MPTQRAAISDLIVRRLYAILLILVGLVLTIGGARLLMLGGSLYYLAAGLAVAASGVLIWRGGKRGVWLYAAMLTATTAWAIWESGFDGWWLAPRLIAPFVLGLGLLLPSLARGPRLWPRMHGGLVFALSLIVAVGLGAGLRAAGPEGPPDPVYQTGVQAQAPAARMRLAATHGDWLHYGNDLGGSRFQPLDQINTGTVGKLREAWRYRTGPAPKGASEKLEVTPLKVGNAVYICTVYNDVISLDAETGRENWRFRSGAKVAGRKAAACRGVAYYRAPGVAGACAERIITNTIDARLIAVDAHTGQPCKGFGDHGQASLLTGMGQVYQGFYYVSSAPTIVRGKIVFGGFVLDNQYWGEPSGVIRAFDATTGRFAWAFDVGRPDQHGEPPPGQTYTHSTPNSWAPMSGDEALGLVYAPTGVSTPDYYGAHRRPFDDKYSSSVVAIDAETGAVRWSFQTVHHDLWDYDVPAQPTLVDIPTDGGVQRALVQPTKRGELFLLDRVTGRPLAAVNEHPAPQVGKAPGERLSATQPFSDGMPSLRGPDLRERSMWGLTPIDQLWCRIKFKEARYSGPLEPPGLTPSVLSPGFLGGTDWGGASVDPERGLLVVNSNRTPNYNRLISREDADAKGIRPLLEGLTSFKGVGGLGRNAAQAGTPYAGDIRAFTSPLMAPCSAPPYGMITAVDLRTRKLVWTKPLGTARGSGPMGIPSRLPFTLGTPNTGGSMVTRGGLAFIAAAQDRTLRAFDVRNGKVAWSASLPAGGQATPSSYWSQASGRQFVVIAASGNAGLKTKTGDYVIAYALPR